MNRAMTKKEDTHGNDYHMPNRTLKSIKYHHGELHLTNKI